MKKVLVILLVLAAVFAEVFAAGVSAKSNLSTGWNKNPSKNVEARRPDASIYNIGGTAFLDDGLYFELGNQFVIKEYSHKLYDTPIVPLKDKKFKENEPVLFFPDFVALYKKDKWAASFNFIIMAGGGTVNYKDGTALTAALIGSKTGNFAMPHKVKVKSIVYGQELTFAFKPYSWLSFAAGLRFAENTQKMEITASALGLNKAGYKAGGFGVGGIFGVHAKPTEKMDLSLQFKTRVGINMEVKDVNETLGGLTSITDYENDIPAELLVGFGYRVAKPVYVSLGAGFFFSKRAYQHSALANLRTGKPDDWDNSWNIQAGVEWDVTDFLCVSGGYNFGQSAGNDETNNIFSPVLANHNIMLGADWKISEQFTASLGCMYLFSADKTYKSSIGSYDLKTNTFIASIGLVYKPL